MCIRKSGGMAPPRETKKGKGKKMEKITVNTKAQLDELEKGSALTFIGCVNTDEEAKCYFDWIRQHSPLKQERLYIVSGWVMNNAYGLTGNNAYKDDLTIFCIKLEDIENVDAITLPRFEIGGRWFDDVVGNNEARQRELNG